MKCTKRPILHTCRLFLPNFNVMNQWVAHIRDYRHKSIQPSPLGQQWDPTDFLFLTDKSLKMDQNEYLHFTVKNGCKHFMTPLTITTHWLSTCLPIQYCHSLGATNVCFEKHYGSALSCHQREKKKRGLWVLLSIPHQTLCLMTAAILHAFRVPFVLSPFLSFFLSYLNAKTTCSPCVLLACILKSQPRQPASLRHPARLHAGWSFRSCYGQIKITTCLSRQNDHSMMLPAEINSAID